MGLADDAMQGKKEEIKQDTQAKEQQAKNTHQDQDIDDYSQGA